MIRPGALVGLMGKMGSGKDTVAKLLLSRTDTVHPKRMAYADKLKESAAAALNIEQSYFEGAKNNENARVEIVEYERGWFGRQKRRVIQSITIRVFLQRYGTEAHRDVFGDNFWVDAALPADTDHSDDLICVTDMRFPNEIKRVRELGGVVVLVKGEDEATGDHASENAWVGSTPDHEIRNDVRDDAMRNLFREIDVLGRRFGLPVNLKRKPRA